MSKDPNEETIRFDDFPSIQASGPTVSPSLAATRPAKLLHLLNSDIPHKQLLLAALEQALKEGNAQSAALFSVRDEFTSDLESFSEIVSRGNIPIPLPQQHPAALAREAFVIQAGPYFIEYQPVQVFGQHQGWLAVASEQLRELETKSALSRIVYFIGLSLERQQYRSQIEHYRNRYQLLTQINVLMACDAGIEEIAQTVTTEIALCYRADFAVMLLRSREHEGLRVVAQFGTNTAFDDSFTISLLSPLGRALLLGGTASLFSVQESTPAGFAILRDIGADCAHWCAVENSAESLGSILLAFKEPRELTNLDREMLEAFAQGAAVALSNASKNRRLSAYAEKLEELVTARTEDLAIQRKRADEASHAKSQFVANMSHELRTPLTAIVGYSSVIARGVFGELSQPQRDALNSITKAAEHLKDLLNDVLDVAKVESGKERVQPAEVEVFSLLKHIHRMMLQTAMSKKVELLSVGVPDDFTQGGISAWIDQRHLRQILINLCSNAIKYTPSGGKVWLTAERQGDKIKIAIHDTGIGISQEDLTNLFDRFSRGQDEYSQSQVGTGLGLSLTKQLVEINGGQIGVESTHGKGSCFWILIPEAQRSIEDDNTSLLYRNSATSDVARLDGLHILIADDSKLTCEVLSTIIQELGGTAVVAHSVHDAMRIVQNQPLDAALVDLAFPGENGIELLDFIRHHNDDQIARVPLLVISACVFDSNRHEALLHGASTFVAKPFDPLEVMQLIRSLTAAAAIGDESLHSGVAHD